MGENERAFDLVIFDLGSTLIYFTEEWNVVVPQMDQKLIEALVGLGYQLDVDAFSRRFREEMRAYYDERSTEFIEYTTVRVVTDLMKEFGLPDPPPQDVQTAVDAMHTVSQPLWKLEEDTYETLDTLQEEGYRLGLISNASHENDVQGLIDQHELRKYFELVLVSAGFGYRKPHPRIFEHALEYYGIKPERAVMVGDTLGADVLGAKQAGLASVWIKRRADRPDNRAHLDTILADAVITDLSELPELLRGWKQNHL